MSDDILNDAWREGVRIKRPEPLGVARQNFEAIWVWLTSWMRTRIFGQTGRNYVASIDEFIKKSTRQINSLFLRSQLDLGWRYVQQYGVYLITIGSFWAGHALFELFDIHVLSTSVSVLMGVAIAALIERTYHHILEHRFLGRYGRKCTHTALRLYGSELFARIAFLGLTQVAQGKLKGVSRET